MRKLSKIFLPLLLALFVALPVSGLAAGSPDFVALAKELKPAVVNISTSQKAKIARPNFHGNPHSPYNDFFDDFFNRFFQRNNLV